MKKRDPEKDTYITCLMPEPSLSQAFNAVAKHAPPGGRTVRPEDFHITLNEIQIPRKSSMKKLLKRIEKVSFPAFDIKFTDVDSFLYTKNGRLKNRFSHVAWLRPDGKSSFDVQALHEKLYEALLPEGFVFEDPDMRPHMTCLYYDEDKDSQALKKFFEECSTLNMPTWRCDKIYLTKKKRLSDPTHPDNNDGKGSRYEIVASFDLKN